LAGISHAEIMLNDIYGRTTAFSALKGKWVLINYWAEWCQTCLDEIPELNRFYETHQQKDIVLFGVNYDNQALFEQQRQAHRFNISYPNLQDPARDLRLGDISGVPVTFIFNPEGALVKTLYGGQSAKNLDDTIAQLKQH
jgi:peroxiredoxin